MVYWHPKQGRNSAEKSTRGLEIGGKFEKMNSHKRSVIIWRAHLSNNQIRVRNTNVSTIYSGDLIQRGHAILKKDICCRELQEFTEGSNSFKCQKKNKAN
jgi:hypothetical protein